MPKATKLHTKGKSKTIQKPCKVERDFSDPEESLRLFQLELCWCIQQLERSLNEKKGNEKQMQETWKVLTVLKNNNQPMIRKRQLMRTHLGDYRAKMEAEEQKLVKMASKIKISDVPDKPKATFLRKSVFMSTGDSSFRFNFGLTPDSTDKSNMNNGANNEPASNADQILSGNTEENSASKLNTGNTEDNGTTNLNTDNTEHSTTNLNTGSTEVSEKKGEMKNFKFSLSGSPFKFNFNVDT